ncbi:bola protein [Diaporthe sp. PMI_573]|nr:bola protein [Diaporthaceae sp. PMI_573]
MLCQRCANLLRGSRLPALPKRAIRQASSSSASPRRPGHPATSTAPWAPRSTLRFPTTALRAGALRPYSSTAPPDTNATAADSTATASTLEKPDFLNEAESEVWDRLAKEFSPVELVVQDISGGCGSMYGIEISSEKFRGANMLKQQRMVNAVLGDLMKTWHGVQLKTRVP